MRNSKETLDRGLDKLGRLISNGSNCVFVTNMGVTPLPPVKDNIRIDEDGNIWLLDTVSIDTSRLKDYSRSVQLFFSNNRTNDYVSIYGKATYFCGKEILDRLWKQYTYAQYCELEEQGTCLIKIEPGETRVWNNSGDRLTGLIQILAHAIAGKHVNSFRA